MDIFDIIGPVMVGPSSSHTAGAVRKKKRVLLREMCAEPISMAFSIRKHLQRRSSA